MKAIARSYVWWPNLDKEIESAVETCGRCQMHRNKPAKAPLHVWPYPHRAWERVHVDFAGPYMGYNFFILVDAYSKWIEAKVMSSTTTAATIATLREFFL